MKRKNFSGDDFYENKKGKSSFDINSYDALKNFSKKREDGNTSFYIKKQDFNIKEPCGIQEIHSNIDLNIIKNRGRDFGTVVLYGLNQLYNYYADFQRFNSSLSIIPSGIIEKDGVICYQFCSSESPLGYWEVCSSSDISSYLYFDNPILYIICPRPFFLEDLTSLISDAEEVNWIQIQGRYTIISPNSGEGSLNPEIFIIGARSPIDPPIILIAEAADNNLIFDSLIIHTTLIDFISIGAYSGFFYNNNSKDFQVNSKIIFGPRIPNQAIYLDSDTSFYIYFYPPLYKNLIKRYWILENTSGSYIKFHEIDAKDPLRFLAKIERYYKILSIINPFNKGFTGALSDTIYIFPNKMLADDLIESSGTSGYMQSKFYPLKSSFYEYLEDSPMIFSGLPGSLKSIFYPLKSTDKKDLDIENIILSGITGKFEVYFYSLTGLIIG